MPSPNRLRRRPPFRSPYPRILIVCEGAKTERGYFLQLRHYHRCRVALELHAGAVPKTLVEQAAVLKKEAENRAKREQDPNFRYEEVWCVFDVDDHPHIQDARQQARDNGIKLAISNPCFELWIVLHFEDQRKAIDRSKLQRVCQKYIPGYQKDVPFEKLNPYYGAAVQRALDLESWQKTRGCSDETNPWTGVHHLTEMLIGVP